MDIKKYIGAFIGVLILVAIVAATAGTLLTSAAGLNTTFAATGLGNLFSVTIFGIILVAGVFYALYKGVQSMH